MKKFYSLFLLTVVAMLGLQAQAAMWLVGDAFNGWNESGNVEMTQDGDIYSYTAEIGANKYFAFFKDTQGWNYQRGPARGNDSAPLGDWEDTQAGGAWKITAAGTYTFEYNYSTDQARIVAGSIVEPDPFDADALTFVATGDAVGGWNMPPTVIFTKNNDGTHSLEINATAAEFKIAGVKDYSSLGWGDFDAGVYGGATLALGDNTLTAGQTANMAMPQAGKLLLTVSDVTESSCNLNIAVVGEAEQAYYLIGSFNEWSDETKPAFTKMDDGSFQLQQALEAGATFKVKDQNGVWYGGDAQGQSAQFELKADFNVTALTPGDAAVNFIINEAGNYTFAIKDGYLTVTGWGEEPQPAELAGVKIIGSYTEDWAEKVELNLELTDEGYKLADQQLGANFEFKVVAIYSDQSEKWLSPASDGKFLVNEEQLGNELALAEENPNLYFPAAGVFNFLVAEDLSKLVINGEFFQEPAAELTGVYIIGSYDAEWTNKEELQLGLSEAGGYVLADQVIDNGFEFKVVARYSDQSEKWFAPASDGKFLVNEEQLGNELALAEENPNNMYFENPGTFTFTVAEDLSKLVITGQFEDVPEPGHSYVLKGSFDEWGEGIAFVEQEDGSFVAEQSLEAGAEFKVMDGETWLGGDTQGQSEKFELKADFNVVELSEAGVNFIINTAGDYTFTIKDGYLTVTGWEEQPEPEKAFYLLGDFNNWNQSEEDEVVAFVKNENNTWEVTRTFKGEFKIKDQDGNWYGGAADEGTNYWLTKENPGTELVNPGENFYFENESEYTLVLTPLEAGGYSIYASGFEEVPEPEHNYVLKGSFDEWGEGIAFAEQEDGSFVAEQSLEAGAEFKVMDGETWLGGDTQGQSEKFELKADFNVVELSEAGVNFIINTAGDYTFTIKDGYLTVTGWADVPEPEHNYVLKGSFD
ncbi:MAG: hypothetical protein IJU62_07265, partial [Muribaculaceae bacterium]|nr:hypothetical protein [Muribaculaceae bacterium]